MTNMYIRYCVATEKLGIITREERIAYEKKLREHAQKNGFELLLFGPAFGDIESPA